MAAQLTDLWEKKASNRAQGIAKKTSALDTGTDIGTAPEMNKLAKRRTCVQTRTYVYLLLSNTYICI